MDTLKPLMDTVRTLTEWSDWLLVLLAPLFMVVVAVGW
jgi:hypothetical protein